MLWDKAFRREAIFRPSSGVLNEAINSGNLSIISNEFLRNTLSSWEADLQHLRQQEETVFDFRMKCYDHLRELGNFRQILDNSVDTETWYELMPSQFNTSNVNLLKSQVFENDLVIFLGTSVYLNANFLSPLKTEIIEITKQIKSELNQ